MSDLASFHLPTLYKIWGEPRSVLSGLRDIQWHHCRGRGGKHNRKMHSSPLNAIPLTDAEHDSGVVNQPELRLFFLRKAQEKVFYAIARGEYELTSIDKEFLQLYQP